MKNELRSGIKSIVITGAGRGIGKALALRFGELGVHVICISKSDNALRTCDEIIANNGSAQSLICDLSNLTEAKKKLSSLVNQLPQEKMGLILAAAILGPRGPIYSSELNSWDETFCTNLLGNLAVYQAFAPRLFQEQFGRIIFFAGGGGTYAFPKFPAYSASKTAVIRTVENMHEELKTQGDFAIVALSPGAIDTDMLREVKRSGAVVRTETSIEKPVLFAEKFMSALICNFSGRLVHVNDEWQNYLDSPINLRGESYWMLRREEH